MKKIFFAFLLFIGIKGYSQTFTIDQLISMWNTMQVPDTSVLRKTFTTLYPVSPVSAWELDGNEEGIVRTIGTRDGFAFPIITDNTERMRVTSTGKVLIGTTSVSGIDEKVNVVGIIRSESPLLSTNGTYIGSDGNGSGVGLSYSGNLLRMISEGDGGLSILPSSSGEVIIHEPAFEVGIFNFHPVSASGLTNTFSFTMGTYPASAGFVTRESSSLLFNSNYWDGDESIANTSLIKDVATNTSGDHYLDLSGSIKIWNDGSVSESLVSAGTYSFTAAAQTATVTITGAAITDLYQVTIKGSTDPVATDLISVEPTSTGFIAHRGALGTNDLEFFWTRRRVN